MFYLATFLSYAIIMANVGPSDSILNHLQQCRTVVKLTESVIHITDNLITFVNFYIFTEFNEGSFAVVLSFY